MVSKTISLIHVLLPLFVVCVLREQGPVCFISASNTVPGLSLAVSMRKDMHGTESINPRKREALQPRMVCGRLHWAPRHSFCVLPADNLGKGPFSWPPSVFLQDYVSVARNLVLSAIRPCSLPFSVRFVHTLFNGLNRGCIYRAKSSSISEASLCLDISRLPT